MGYPVRGRARVGAIGLLTAVLVGAGAFLPSRSTSGPGPVHLLAPILAPPSAEAGALQAPAPPTPVVPASVPRPVVLTTDAELDRARARAGDPASPFQASWRSVMRQADHALERRFAPQESDDVATFHALANPEARSVHALAVAYRVTGDRAHLRRARKALMAWATTSNADLPAGDPSPSWRDFQYPGKAMPDAAGLHISRVLVVFADAYAMLHPDIPEAERHEIERWFASMRSPIQRSANLWETQAGHSVAPDRMNATTAPWMGQQAYSNHLAAHAVGLLAIGSVTGDHRLIEYALDDPDNPRDLLELFRGTLLAPGADLHHGDPTLTTGTARWPAPLPGEIYDRYRVLGRSSTGDKGIIYTSLGQRFLSLGAEIAANNGAPVDYWRALGASGGSLLDSYHTYGPFVSEPDDALACRGRYHEGSATGPNVVARWRAMAEMAFREHPWDPAIRRIVRTAAVRDYNDSETFGAAAPLLKGEPLDARAGPSLRLRDPEGRTTLRLVPSTAGADAHFLGDWNGDGVDTPGWRIGNVFHLSDRADGGNAEAHPLGASCDDPLVGDWTGNGRDSIGVRRGTEFHLARTPGETPSIRYSMGRPGDRVVIGDWNGDGIDTPALARGNQVFVRASNAPRADNTSFGFGRDGDRFVAGDWNSDGIDTLAAVRESGDELTWHLRSGNGPDSPVAEAIAHGRRYDGALAGRTTRNGTDRLVTVRYRD